VPHVIDLTADTVFAKLIADTNIRAAIDRVTPRPRPAAVASKPSALMAARKQSRDDVQEAQIARARALRTTIRKLQKP